MPRNAPPQCSYADDLSGPGYGLHSAVVVAQMEGRVMPHTEVQTGDHWEMHVESGSAQAE